MNGHDFVFPGGKLGKPLSQHGDAQAIAADEPRRANCSGLPIELARLGSGAHQLPREVAEMALAHTVSDKVEAAYRRGDLSAKRRRLMEEWARHCEFTKGTGKASHFWLPRKTIAAVRQDQFSPIPRAVVGIKRRASQWRGHVA